MNLLGNTKSEMLNTPEHFSEEQKKAYQKAWFDTFNTLMAGIKIIVFLAVFLLLYIPFGKHFSDWFKSSPEYLPDSSALNVFNSDPDKVENGIHLQTGLAYAPGFELVKANCTVCHSAKLVTQNRATKEGWSQMIEWMEKTQGLWDLGPNKSRIIDYLATNYAPEEKGRRENINMQEIEWYILEIEE